MQTSNARLLLAGTLLLVALSCVGAVVWWLTAGQPLSAQGQVADACADAEPIESVDFTINWYDPEGNLAARHIGQTSTTGMYTQHYDPNARNTGPRSTNSGRSDGLMSESIQIWGSDGVTRAASGESVPVAKYQRDYEGGQWTAWEARQDSSPGGAGSNNRFCSWDLDSFTTLVYNGTETLDGVSTKKFTGTIQYTLDRTDVWEFWVNGDGEVPLNRLTTNGYVLETVSYGFNEPNTITAPVAGTPAPTPGTPNSGKPTLIPTPPLPNTPVPTPADTPVPANTPVSTDTPAPAPVADAWLEPEPETVTFDGSQWREFTVHVTGLDQIDLGTNVWPNSTGAVGSTSRPSPPSIAEGCEDAVYTGYTLRDGRTFNMVGCQAGTVIIQLGHYVGDNYDYVLLRRYTVTVSGGP